MTTIKLIVDGAHAEAQVDGPLTSGMVALPVSFCFDSSWEGLNKTLVCRSSSTYSGIGDSIRTIVNVEDGATVAHEVMVAGRTLFLGLEGRSPDGTRVIPTVWAECGEIQPGATGNADPTAEATPEVWAQIIGQMGSLASLNTDHKDNLVMAINEAMTKGDGAPGAAGRGIASVSGNEDGSWTFTYTDGAQETVSNEAYQAMLARVNQLSEEIAGKMQLEPEFANSIEECTDITKLYVLPDGVLYAYMTKQTASVKPELADRSGYLLNTRFNGSGAETAADGWYVTNYLSVNMSLADPLVMKFEGRPPFYGARLQNTNGNISERACFYDADKNLLGGPYTVFHKETAATYTMNSIVAKGAGFEWTVDVGYVFNSASAEEKASFYDKIAYVRFACNYATAYSGPSPLTSVDEIEACSITLDAQGGTEEVAGWISTGHAFVPADYESRIVAVEKHVSGHAKCINQNSDDIAAVEERVSALECGQFFAIPDYWRTHLEEKVALIRESVLKAGANKSAFFFYSDSHWSNDNTYTAKLAPALLKYLYQHTPINKTNYGGDIVGTEDADADVMAYLWEWRSKLYGLPNHHSVVGNHDDGNSTNNLFSENYVYGYLLALEETPDIVRGDGSMYYYIDNPAEKTRYLYLDTAYKGVTDAEKAFVKAALLSTPAGWHIVAIAHAWYANDYTVDPPVLAGIDSGAKKLLDMFDSYNARSGEYTGCGGKVEFCIGGHYHLDYDGETAGGIPIILVEADCLHNRSGTMPNVDTTDEAAVTAVIANYNANKISIIRVGRGIDREIVW